MYKLTLHLLTSYQCVPLMCVCVFVCACMLACARLRACVHACVCLCVSRADQLPMGSSMYTWPNIINNKKNILYCTKFFRYLSKFVFDVSRGHVMTIVSSQALSY
jgi:hypothetical protein